MNGDVVVRAATRSTWAAAGAGGRNPSKLTSGRSAAAIASWSTPRTSCRTSCTCCRATLPSPPRPHHDAAMNWRSDARSPAPRSNRSGVPDRDRTGFDTGTAVATRRGRINHAHPRPPARRHDRPPPRPGTRHRHRRRTVGEHPAECTRSCSRPPSSPNCVKCNPTSARSATIGFCAKEAAFKAQFPLTGRMLDFHDLELDLIGLTQPDLLDGTVTLLHPELHHLSVRFFHHDLGGTSVAGATATLEALGPDPWVEYHRADVGPTRGRMRASGSVCSRVASRSSATASGSWRTVGRPMMVRASSSATKSNQIRAAAMRRSSCGCVVPRAAAPRQRRRRRVPVVVPDGPEGARDGGGCRVLPVRACAGVDAEDRPPERRASAPAERKSITEQEARDRGRIGATEAMQRGSGERGVERTDPGRLAAGHARRSPLAVGDEAFERRGGQLVRQSEARCGRAHGRFGTDRRRVGRARRGRRDVSVAPRPAARRRERQRPALRAPCRRARRCSRPGSERPGAIVAGS